MSCFASLRFMNQMRAQAFAAEVPLKLSHEGVVSRFAGTGEVDLRSILVSPQVHRMTGELAAVVAKQHLRNTAFEL